MVNQKLNSVLVEDPVDGLSIKARHLIPDKDMALREVPLLKYYCVDPSVEEIIAHNLRWANGSEGRPMLKFAYVDLPTSCNQRCMGCFTGNDKGRLLPQLDGYFYNEAALDEITTFLIGHCAESIVYSGGGELFTWDGAFDYIERIMDAGLSMMIFTNGTLLSKSDVDWLSKRNISLTISIRGTTERDHDAIVRARGFRKSIRTLEYALESGLHEQNKLAVELPVTKGNSESALYDFIPAMRLLGVIPFAEEYIQVTTSTDEKRLCHDFNEARAFFSMACEIDRKFGYSHDLVFGERMLAQGKCRRPLYSFIIYPNGDVMDCPSSSIRYGNMFETSLRDVIYSDCFKYALRSFSLCPCSTFYTENESQVPIQLPSHLEVFR